MNNDETHKYEQLPEDFAEANEYGVVWLSPAYLQGYIEYCMSLELDANFYFTRNINSDGIAFVAVRPSDLPHCYVFTVIFPDGEENEKRTSEDITIPVDRFVFFEHYFTSGAYEYRFGEEDEECEGLE